ncbi:MAG: 2-C-methyl-D-erythritol 4-phosphate cytidylyltransferase, partial [Hyphomicrobiaceae bacterium]
MHVAAVIVAAGRGLRASRGDARPKQYVELAGRSLLTHTIEALARHPGIDALQVVIHPDDTPAYDVAVAALTTTSRAKLLPPIFGGSTRQASGLAGLEALESRAPALVLIHDAARPFIESGIIDRVLAALDKADGAIPALRVADTIKRETAAGNI